MNNYFLAGFVAGEGSFTIHKPKYNGINCYFEIETHIRDIEMLKSIQRTFKYGKVVVYPYRPNICRYKVSGVRNCRKLIIPFMNKYLISSYKKVQYKQWRKVVLNYKLKISFRQ